MRDHIRAGYGAGLVVTAATGGVLAASVHGPSFLDPAFVPMRYARHLAAGDGLVYNLGERVEGFGDPLWTGLLALLAALGCAPMDAVTGLGIAGLGLLILLVGWIGTRQLGEAPGVLAALLVAAWPPMWVAARSGDDAIFQGVLVLWSTGLMLSEVTDERRSRWGTVALVLTALSGLIGAIVATLLAAAGARRAPSGIARLLGVLGVLFALTALRWAYFGDPIPNHLRAMPWGGEGRFAVGGDWLVRLIKEAPALWGLGLVGGIWALLRGGAWRPMALVVLLVGLIAVGGGPARVLLWHPLIPVVGLMALLGVGLLASMSQAPIPSKLLLLALLIGFGSQDLRVAAARSEKVTKARRGRFVQARAMGRFLELRFPDEELLAMHKPGVVGHFTDNPILDLSGHIDRRIAHAPRRDLREPGKPSRSDIEGAVARSPVVFLHPRSMTGARPGRIPVPPWYPDDFDSHYASIAITARPHWEVAETHPLWLFFFLRSGLKPTPEWLKKP